MTITDYLEEQPVSLGSEPGPSLSKFQAIRVKKEKVALNASEKWFAKPADSYSPEEGFHMSQDKGKSKALDQASEGVVTLNDAVPAGADLGQGDESAHADDVLPDAFSEPVPSEVVNDAAAPDKSDDEDYEDIELRPARRSRRRNKTREVFKNNARAKSIEQNGVRVSLCSSCMVGFPQGYGLFTDTLQPQALDCIVWVGEELPRSNAVPKCSNCASRSGKYCSHTEIVNDLRRFRAGGPAPGFGLRAADYVDLFRGADIETWGTQLGLNLDQREHIRKRIWENDFGRQVSLNQRFQALPSSMVEMVRRNDPRGPGVMPAQIQAAVGQVDLSPSRSRQSPVGIHSVGESRVEEVETPAPVRRSARDLFSS